MTGPLLKRAVLARLSRIRLHEDDSTVMRNRRTTTHAMARIAKNILHCVEENDHKSLSCDWSAGCCERMIRQVLLLKLSPKRTVAAIHAAIISASTIIDETSPLDRVKLVHSASLRKVQIIEIPATTHVTRLYALTPSPICLFLTFVYVTRAKIPPEKANCSTLTSASIIHGKAQSGDQALWQIYPQSIYRTARRSR